MTRRQRHVHLIVWIVLTSMLALGLAAALLSRPPIAISSPVPERGP